MQGLQNVVESLLPYAEHRNCALHIHANWKKKGHSTMMLKNMFWKAVKCTTPQEFECTMLQMEAMQPQAAHDFQAVGVQKFCRAFISTRTTSPTTDNNVCESDVSFLCVVKTQRRWSNKIYKTELTKTRYNNQVLGKYQVDPQGAGLTLIAELTWSNVGLKGVLNKRK